MSSLNETARPFTPSIGFPDTSLNAPLSMLALTGPFEELANAIEVYMSCESERTSVGPPDPRTEAPDSRVARLPNASVTPTRDEFADAAPTCSLNVKEIVLASRLSSMGGADESASSSGAVVSLSTEARAPANAAEGFHDTSGNAPRCADTSIERVSGAVQHAAAAALCASVSEITATGDAPGGAAGALDAAVGSGEADAPARPMPESHAPPPAEDSDTSDGSAADALTYSSNLTARVPSSRSSNGGADALRRGAAASERTMTSPE